jgi:hypothetical protein
MNREFTNWNIVTKDFDKNQTNKVMVELLDVNNKQLEQIELTVISAEEIYELIDKKRAIHFSEVFIADFSLDNYRKSRNIANSEIIDVSGINIQASFLFDEKSIDFSAVQINEHVNFTHSVFLQKTNFKNSQINAAGVLFEYCTFFDGEFDFSELVCLCKEFSFKNAIFRQGVKNFQNTRFDTPNLNFINTQFGQGDVLFNGSKFSAGRKSFKVANFGTGRVDFNNVDFNEGEVIFEKTNFGEGTVNFRSTKFLNGKIEFMSALFGDGDINFIHTDFGNGSVSFKNTNFGNGKVSFKLAEFGAGKVDFHFAEFSKGDLIFDRTNFGIDSVDFRAVNFGNGRVNFNRCRFHHGEFIVEASELHNSNFYLTNCLFEQANINMENLNFATSTIHIINSELQGAKVSFKQSKIQKLLLESIQLDNYVDLRMETCELLDLSDTVVKGILDITPDEYSANINSINLSGMRLLGRIYIDWHKSGVKNFILQQKTDFHNKAEQFRILKENYNSIGQYESEDAAYVEFKRAEAKANLSDGLKSKNLSQKLLAYPSFIFRNLIFDKVGKYATDPIRVLISMAFTYLLFSLLYVVLPFFTDAGIVSSLFTPDDPRDLGIMAKAFYHSAVTFLTIGYGDYYPSGINRGISGFEGFVGLFLMSYFTVAFVRKILR